MDVISHISYKINKLMVELHWYGGGIRGGAGEEATCTKFRRILAPPHSQHFTPLDVTNGLATGVGGGNKGRSCRRTQTRS